jgi:sulfur-carrier protein
MSAVNIKIPTQLRENTSGQAEVSVTGSTVRECLDSLFEVHPALRERITENGEVRRFVNLYVNGEDVRFIDGVDSTVAAGGEITILPAVAGG